MRRPPPHLTAARPGWCIVLPLKGGSAAKSRLGADPALAQAIAEDCLDAVLACPGVRTAIVVTADPDTAGWAGSAGATVVTESVPGAGLAAAIRDGLAGAHGPCAVLLGDLPALRPGDLRLALDAAAQRLSATLELAGARPAGRRPQRAGGSLPPMVFVPDAEGSGTVMLAAETPTAMDHAFGPGSAREHARRGAVRLDLDLPRLRRDVDTEADLHAAAVLGCGPRTTARLAEAEGGRWVR